MLKKEIHRLACAGASTITIVLMLYTGIWGVMNLIEWVYGGVMNLIEWVYYA